MVAQAGDEAFLLIDLIVCANGFKKNGVLSLVFYKFKYKAEVITGVWMFGGKTAGRADK